MATTVSIPNTGYKTGTCGWLAKGLADGSIKIAPGTTKGGKGGLWLHADGKQGCLAIFNEYDLDPDSFSDAHSFAVVASDFCGSFPLTDSASEYLRCAAEEWCEAANAARENDVPADMPRLVVSTNC